MGQECSMGRQQAVQRAATAEPEKESLSAALERLALKRRNSLMAMQKSSSNLAQIDGQGVQILSPENLAALTQLQSARRKAGVRIPFIGLLQGRLTMHQLLTLWNKHDRYRLGKMLRDDLKNLLRDVLLMLPEMVQKTGKYALQPMRDLAELTRERRFATEADELEDEYTVLVASAVAVLRDKMKHMPKERLENMLERMLDVLDVNHDGWIDREEFIVAFMPSEPIQRRGSISRMNTARSSMGRSVGGDSTRDLLLERAQARSERMDTARTIDTEDP